MTNQPQKNTFHLNRTERLILIVIALAIALSALVYTARGTTFFNVTLDDNSNLETGLVAHYTFDGPDMDEGVEDTSGNGNDGVFENLTSTTTVIGIHGQALALEANGSLGDGSAHINAGSPADFDLLNNFTISMWVYADSSNSQNTLIQKGATNDEYMMFMSSTNFSFRVMQSDGFNTASTPKILGRWVFLVGRYDGSRVSIFVDGGTEAHGVNLTGDIDNSPSTNLIIGGAPNGYGWDGKMDDVRVYNKALTDEEIQRLYELGATTHINTTLGDTDTGSSLSQGLIGHWTFDGPDMVSNVADSSGYGNDGRLLNQTPTTSAMGVLGQSLELDGSNDYVYRSTFSGATSTGGSVAFWLFADGAQNGGTGFITTGPAAPLVTVSGSNIRPRAYDSSFNPMVDNSWPFALNEWAHYVGTWHAGGGELYENGVLVDSDTTGTSSYGVADDIFIGADRGIASRYLDGKMDDVRMYNRALSADEARRLYELGATTHINTTLGDTNTGSALSQGLIGHWTFDGPDMDEGVEDTTGNGHDGSLTGFLATTSTIGPIGQALEFATSTNRVLVPHNVDLRPAEMSASFWLKTPTNNGITRVIDKSTADYTIRTYDTGRMEFVSTGGGCTTFFITNSNVRLANTWQHWVLTAGSDGCKWYVDGVADATNGTAFIAGSGTDGVSFSSLTSPLGDSGPGTALDDVRIYNRVLSADEISRLHDLGR